MVNRIIAIFVLLCWSVAEMRATDPIYFDHYVVIDGDTIDIGVLYEEIDTVRLCQPATAWQRLMAPIDWPRTLTTLGLRVGFKIAIDNSLKHYVNELRPDGSDYKSFPSRHATWAYGIGCTVGYTLGPYSPWWMVGSNIIANGIGMQRVMKRRHYPHDVLAGAAIGIGTDLLSKVIGDWIFGPQRLFPYWRQCVNANSPWFAVTTEASLPLHRHYGNYNLGTSLRSTLMASMPMGNRFAFNTALGLESGFIKGPNGYVQPLNALSARVGAMAHLNFGESPFGLSLYANAGYKRNLKPKEIDVKGGTAIGEIGLQSTVMLTCKLALGLTASYNLAAFGIEGVNRTAQSVAVGFLSKAYF